jgi:hypothetical protein
LRLNVQVLWFRREKNVKSTKRDEPVEHAGNYCKVPEHAIDVGDGLLHDLGDAGKVPNLSEDKTMRPELGTSCIDQVRGTLIYLHTLRA